MRSHAARRFKRRRVGLVHDTVIQRFRRDGKWCRERQEDRQDGCPLFVNVRQTARQGIRALREVADDNHGLFLRQQVVQCGVQKHRRGERCSVDVRHGVGVRALQRAKQVIAPSSFRIVSGVVRCQLGDLLRCGLQVYRHQTVLARHHRFGQRGVIRERKLIDRRVRRVPDVQPVVVAARHRKLHGGFARRCLQPHGQHRSSVVRYRQRARGRCHDRAVGDFHDVDRHGICAGLVAHDVDIR